MSRLYFIQDGQQTRRLDENSLPIMVGNSDEATICIADLPEGLMVAYIAEEGGHAYLQPAPTPQAVFHNHIQISESVWLKSGDWIHIGDTALHWQVKGDQVFIHVAATYDQAMPSPPPPSPTPEIPPAEIPIAVTEAHVPSTNKQAPTASQRLVRRSVIAALISLALAALFVVLATPMTIRLSPDTAEYSLSGFPAAVPFAGRLLVLPGEYRIQASHPGYRDLDETVSVRGGPLQEFNFAMQPLPGRLTLRVEPNVPYSLYVDDVETALVAQAVAELEAGQRRIRIATQRYLPHEQLVEIEGFGKAQQLAVTLQPAWTSVYIDSEPQGAAVHVGDRLLGKTPLQTELRQGLHNISLSLPAFKPLTIEQTITAGKSLRLTGLKLSPADAELDLTSHPAGATITVNGQFHDTTPATLSLASNTTQHISLTKPGYKPMRKRLKLAPAEKQTLSLKLVEEFGTVFVRSQPADARLFVDGKDVGAATQRLRLSTQPHTLKLEKAGYTPQQLTITPRAGVSQTFTFDLKTIAQTKRATTPAVITTAAGQSLRLIRPTGSFHMGASRREAGRRANESQRLVALSRAFYFSEKEVTNAEYRLFRGSHNSGTAEGAQLNGDKQPVVKISWDDAARYCNWLSDKQGLPPAYAEQQGKMMVIRPLTTGYRLPTEAEWAYVARRHARTSSARYPWAGAYPPTTRVGNFADAQISNTLADTVPGYDDRYRATAPVGSFTARPAGFYDLGGNVAEWTNDYYTVYPASADKLVTDPLGPDDGQHRIVRDSSWRHGNITELRLSYRDYSRTARDDLGFRIARYAE